MLSFLLLFQKTHDFASFVVLLRERWFQWLRQKVTEGLIYTGVNDFLLRNIMWQTGGYPPSGIDGIWWLVGTLALNMYISGTKFTKCPLSHRISSYQFSYRRSTWSNRDFSRPALDDEFLSITLTIFYDASHPLLLSTIQAAQALELQSFKKD